MRVKHARNKALHLPLRVDIESPPLGNYALAPKPNVVSLPSNAAQYGAGEKTMLPQKKRYRTDSKTDVNIKNVKHMRYNPDPTSSDLGIFGKSTQRNTNDDRYRLLIVLLYI